MKLLRFSNGLSIDSSQIVTIESNQQSFGFPGAIGELEHLLQGRPGGLVVHLKDGSNVKIIAGQARLSITESES